MGWKRTSHADDGESGFGVSLHAERERERCAWLHATASSSPRPIASRQLTQTVTIYGRSPPFPLPAEKKAVKRPVRHHCVPWPYTFREISQNKPPHNVFPTVSSTYLASVSVFPTHMKSRDSWTALHLSLSDVITSFLLHQSLCVCFSWDICSFVPQIDREACFPLSMFRTTPLLVRFLLCHLLTQKWALQRRSQVALKESQHSVCLVSDHVTSFTCHHDF